MAIDSRYQDNVVLKQDAFQNLLTNIKNYPIVDIDYIAETDTDELHGDFIWDNYTDGIPCIKITYGDDRTTKGNIIFSENNRLAINKAKREISQLQTILSELNKKKSRWELVFEQNKTFYDEKSNEVLRFQRNFEKIQANKLSFLKSGWTLLYDNDAETSLKINDPYVPVSTDVAYNANTVYYVHSDEYFFKRYEFDDGSGNLCDVHDSNLTGTAYNNMLADWTERRNNRDIFTKQVTDRGPVLSQELGPQYFSYQNILLNQNPYSLVSTTTPYDETIEYWERASASNSMSDGFVEYVYNYTSPENENYSEYLADWTLKRDNNKIYTKIEQTDAVKTFNLEYTTLNSTRLELVQYLLTNRNNKKGDGTNTFTPEQQEVFDNFIDFIHSYNTLVFLDTIGVAGYTADDLEYLKTEYPTLVPFINALETENEYNYNDFDWESHPTQWNHNWPSYAATFLARIEDIVTLIKNKINQNLIYIRQQIRNVNYSIMEYNERIQTKQQEISELQSQIDQAVSNRYDLVPKTAEFNEARQYDYCIKISDDPEKYQYYGGNNWEQLRDSDQLYIRNDRTMFGYKYVKVGSNITFDNTYYPDANGPSPTEAGLNAQELFEKFNSASEQASGTFRITINKHIYEVPIKGFTINPSNQPIFIQSEDTSDPTNNPNGFGSINFFGNLVGAGSIVTNNGNIYASGGAVAASTYLALGGYAGQSTYNSANIQTDTGYEGEDGVNNHAGLWYDGSTNRLIRTWNISADNDTVGLGSYQFVLSNGTKNTNDDVGIIGNGNVVEFHTGVPSNSDTNSNLADIKAGNLILGYGGSTPSNYNLTINGRTLQISHLPNSTSDTAHFWRGDGSWSNVLTSTLILSATTDASESQNNNVALVTGDRTAQHLEIDGNEILSKANANTMSSLWLNGSQAYYEIISNEQKAVFKSTRIYNAVFNDYAEYRTTIDLEPGRVVIDNDDGSLSCATQRLQPGAQVISDTFGTCMGKTDNCETPLAVAGRVLVYPYQTRENYHAGMAVCSAPDGTIDIMTREEIKNYPDCIIGIVSEIPQYETWGTANVKVNGRIWIKIK